MTIPYAVALVLDADFGRHLKELSERMDTWVVGTQGNVAIAQAIWKVRGERSAQQKNYSLTTVAPDTKDDPIGWWQLTIEALDLHHNEHSHDPGWTALDVYGAPFYEALMPALHEYGFSTIESTEFGFRADLPGFLRPFGSSNNGSG